MIRKGFYSLSISKKLAVVFMMVLSMMGVGGLVGLYNAGQLADLTESLYVDSFKRGEILSSVENELLSARQEIFLHTLIREQASKSYLEGSIIEHQQKIAKLIAEYKSLGISKKQERILSDFNSNLSRYWSVHNKIETRGREQSLTIISTEGNKAFVESINTLKRLRKDERDTAHQAYHRGEFFADVIIAVTIAFTVLAIVTAAGLWLTLTRSLVKPIVSLRESALKIGQGDLKYRAPIVNDDEIGHLAAEFNKMAEGLENYYTTLEKKVEERTEELKGANEELFKKQKELEFANIELSEANKMKSQFLANVSHELRTPLNSIIGFSELLQEMAFGELNDRQVQYVEYIHSSGSHLLQLINNILDLSKMEAGRMGMAVEDFSVMEALGEVLGIVRPLAHERGMEINSKTVPASPKIRADKAKFKQIMMNLLSNAVKFNKKGGAIDVDWSIAEEPRGMRLERFITFSVKDTGIGIRDEDKVKVFKEFEQVDATLAREYGGTGLGLVLTKRLAELHGGEVWFESEYGKGSTFFVKLPQGTEEIDIPVYTPRAIVSPGGNARLVVLAAESQDINHLLQIYLAGDAYEVLTAADGVELLRLSNEQKPYAIIMGIALPKKDGWEVLKELKSNQETADIPVVILSSLDNKEMGYSLGASEYMEKGVNREMLLAALDRIGSKKAG